ncbi:CU044_5270 family protein [Actinomadura barringtoniae]|uniref:CU044_5270 family protein n=1 Tax=Actinomadura barringtoniae TaxID=1427535 RepID=A0A939T1Q4_9ACTN|nr:CU044_5270 family protein [Actinomadura barringtoniae]MBO2448041.1 CU044_5270 family protein [Actinomadura barringtoniae]
MDELDALRGMRTDLTVEESPERLALRVNWRAERSARRSRSSWRLPMIGLAAATAVAAGAVAVITVGSDGGPATPGKSGTPPTVALGGGNALLVAATNAEKAPVGAYWYVKRIMGEINDVGKSRADHYQIDARQGVESWVDSTGRQQSFHLDWDGRPVGPEGLRKWQAAGSPKWVKAPCPEHNCELLMSGGNMRNGQPPINDMDYFGLTAKQVTQLPTTPEGLRAALLNVKANWRAVSPRDGRKERLRDVHGAEQVRALSDVAGSLLSEAPAPPKVRAAAFRLLASLPGIKAEGTAADPLGRKGTVISLPLVTTTPLGLSTAPRQLGTYRRQWIIDPARGMVLAIRDLTATPPHGHGPYTRRDSGKMTRIEVNDMPDRFHKPGELVAYTVYETAEWTNAGPR